MKLRKTFLLAATLGLVPIALAYGLVPVASMEFLFDMKINEPNGAHIFRAVMGLYLATASFWIIGALKPSLRQSAILSLVVFMWGLALGRILSVFVDGAPNALLILYIVLELAFGIVGLVLLNKRDMDEPFT